MPPVQVAFVAGSTSIKNYLMRNSTDCQVLPCERYDIFDGVGLHGVDFGLVEAFFYLRYGLVWVDFRRGAPKTN
jgi:hypothetical protein